MAVHWFPVQFLHDLNGEDHFSSKIGVGGLLNTDKINLVSPFCRSRQCFAPLFAKVCLILDNLEVFQRHHRNVRPCQSVPFIAHCVPPLFQLGRYIHSSDCLSNGGFVAANDHSPSNANNVNNGTNNNSSVPNVSAVHGNVRGASLNPKWTTPPPGRICQPQPATEHRINKRRRRRTLPKAAEPPKCPLRLSSHPNKSFTNLYKR